MAQSIKMHRIQTSPVSYPVESEEVSTGINSVTFKTKVEHIGQSEYDSNLKKLKISHQIGGAFEGKGILEDGSIHNIIATATTEEFPCFVKDELYLYTSGTRREVSAQALRRLRRFKKHDNHLIAENIKLNLLDFKSYLEHSEEGNIKGGWFRGMSVKNVEVAYLGGGAVTESDDWDRYETSGGEISALRIDLPLGDLEDEPTKVLLTRDGNCVVYKNVGEHGLLNIAIPLFNAAEQFIE
ncbi:hypothetical protein QMZ64_21640 [Bacillus sp. LB7]|uniref:Uncharacterized protein n=1 Tax=Bacillus licheniformis TaxID=1402 RepID=A0A8B5YBF2_BACLI|nr:MULTISPECIES: hypothetical protein [Bacillus]MDN5389994.1 hypothetical protein [Bacillus sp. LB7]TWL26091.1 hypothetical protein CHCC16736_0014 [Bacillus licheniformis]